MTMAKLNRKLHDSLVEKLGNAETRLEAFHLVHNINTDTLLDIAFTVGVQDLKRKEARVGYLIKSIIECTVGTKLRSEVLRGMHADVICVDDLEKEERERKRRGGKGEKS